MADASSAQPNFLVAVGGDPAAPASFPDPVDLADTIVVAADSGLDHALAAGLSVDHVVGDLDSVAAASLAAAGAAGATIHRYEADKDATDLELAIDLVVELALALDVGRLLVVGPGGGRLDHQVADLLQLAGPRLTPFEVTARFGPAAVAVVRPGRPRHLAGRPREQVSLLPLHGAATGVTTSGLRWPLVDADLVVGTTRAMSNELVGVDGAVAISGGVLLVIQPGTVAAPIDPRSTPYDPTPRRSDP